MLDGTKQRMQRPKYRAEQKVFYSGKKVHTAKTLIISTKDKRIRFLSAVYVGTAHDYAILKTEFPPDQHWFKGLEVRLDLGYQGFGKDYLYKKVCLPHKKPKKAKLNEVQKAQNKAGSSERITVKHIIGGMKRY